jgi:hypothetical protein
MADLLAALSPPELAAFYRRLAASIQARFSGDSLAAVLLLHWLDGKGADKVYPARYVSGLAAVRSYLKETARPIYLSQRRTPSGTLGGIVPRIQGTIRATPPGGPYTMHLEGNVETSVGVQAKAAIGLSVEPRELDALYALHGFLLVTDVVASAKKGAGGFYDVRFERWTCKASDEYHWNPDKHITVPNPDFGSTAPTAVAPKDREVVVYHSNAIRLEKAGLAQAFHDESEPWEEKADLGVVGPASVRV